MDAATISAIASAAATAIGVIAAVGSVAWQLRRQSQLNSATMMLALADKFMSPEWRTYRARCADVIMKHLSGQPVDLSVDFPVLGFFENLGYLVRAKIIDKEMVWNKFGWYIVRYHSALRSHGDLIQQNCEREHDPTLWEEFCWLDREMVKIYRMRGVDVSSMSETARHIAELIRQESTAPTLTAPLERTALDELSR